MESLPATLHTPEAMETFQRLQPLPFSQRQEAVLHAQLGASWDFQVAGTHWRLGQLPLVPACAPWFDPCSDAANGVPTFVPWPRTYLCVEAALSAETWTSMLLYDLRHTAVHSCLHDCRPRTCHKGRLGKAGFCRLGFWHWRDVAPWTAPDTWQRCHGLHCNIKLRWTLPRRLLAPGVNSFRNDIIHFIRASTPVPSFALFSSFVTRCLVLSISFAGLDFCSIY